MTAPSTYRGSITREQWLANETRTVARLMVRECIADTAELVQRVTESNLFGYPTEREQRSIARACARRLNVLSDAPSTRVQLINLIAEGTPDQLRQTNLYAMARDNRIVWDFLAGLVAHKTKTLDFALTRREIEMFLQGLRQQSDRAATWSDSTMNKIRQVLTQCLEQSGIYNRKTQQISQPILDFELEQCMRANDDTELLAAFGITQ